ncbi:hypothetical protein AYJ56_17230 [Brucella anthropi]|nr:hypothetical protein [Brucella anthropi]KXO72936.1 hypothetical protein AYJ56_17230 [Brucella anthropi]
MKSMKFLSALAVAAFAATAALAAPSVSTVDTAKGKVLAGEKGMSRFDRASSPIPAYSRRFQRSHRNAA